MGRKAKPRGKSYICKNTQVCTCFPPYDVKKNRINFLTKKTPLLLFWGIFGAYNRWKWIKSPLLDVERLMQPHQCFLSAVRMLIIPPWSSHSQRRSELSSRYNDFTRDWPSWCCSAADRGKQAVPIYWQLVATSTALCVRQEHLSLCRQPFLGQTHLSHCFFIKY